MGDVRIDINVSEIKANIRDVIDKKTEAVRGDPIVLNQLAYALKDEMVNDSDFPVDSGAMQSGTGPRTTNHTTWVDAKGRVHEASQYPRYGFFDVISHARQSKLVIDPIEIRPSRDVHYASHREDTLNEIAQMAVLSDSFLEQATDIIGEKMRKS